MAKLYSEKTPQIKNDLNPKEETVNFLLNYSKALSVIDYNKLKLGKVLKVSSSGLFFIVFIYNGSSTNGFGNNIFIQIPTSCWRIFASVPYNLKM